MSIWEAAIAEARASASVNHFEIETIEMLHPAFVSAENMPDSLRLVLDERDWNLQLEAGAPLNGGQTVAFTPAAMRIAPPAQEEGSLGSVRLVFDFVSRAVQPWLDKAVSIRADGKLILRTWLATRNEVTGDYAVAGPPLEVLAGLTVRDVQCTATSVELTAQFRDLVNVGFPRRYFRQEDFPGLF